MNEKFPYNKESGNLGQKISYVLIFTQFVCVQNMRKFAPFENFLLYGTMLLQTQLNIFAEEAQTANRGPNTVRSFASRAVGQQFD